MRRSRRYSLALALACLLLILCGFLLGRCAHHARYRPLDSEPVMLSAARDRKSVV
jgi:hypothetical protein